jgi:hypothetical protein
LELNHAQILPWADAHFVAQGKWPSGNSHATVAPSADGNWIAVDSALRVGHRGLPGGSSLFQLLKKHGRIRQG